MWWNGRLTSWMCSRQICSNCVMLSCQYRPISPCWIYAMKNLRQFWRQKRVQRSTSKVYLIKRPVRVYYIENSYFKLYISWYYCFYCIIYWINVALVSIKYLFKKSCANFCFCRNHQNPLVVCIWYKISPSNLWRWTIRWINTFLFCTFATKI